MSHVMTQLRYPVLPCLRRLPLPPTIQKVEDVNISPSLTGIALGLLTGLVPLISTTSWWLLGKMEIHCPYNPIEYTRVFPTNPFSDGHLASTFQVEVSASILRSRFQGCITPLACYPTPYTCPKRCASRQTDAWTAPKP